MRELRIKSVYEKRIKILEEKLKENPDDTKLIQSIEHDKKSLKTISLINNNINNNSL